MRLGTEVARPWPWPHVLDGDPAVSPQWGTVPIFDPCLSWPNGWTDQYATWYGGRPRPGDIVLDGDPAPPPFLGGAAGSSSQFSAQVCCGHTAGWIKMPLDMEVASALATLC